MANKGQLTLRRKVLRWFFGMVAVIVLAFWVDSGISRTAAGRFDLLLNGKEVDRTEFCRDYAISVRTFYRYLQEIRDYLRLAHRGFVLLNDRGATYRLRAKEADGDVSSDVGTAETNRC